MRVLLRVLAPLVSLAVAALGALVLVETVADWAQFEAGPAAPAGVLVPWRDWRTTLENLLWTDPVVLWVAIGAIVAGVILLVVALLARRHEVPIVSPSAGLTVNTSPRVLARLVGSRVRAEDVMTGASVTASKRSVLVRATGRGDTVRDDARAAASAVLDGLPLMRRPKLTVRATEDQPGAKGVH
ncbi:DUF6286 domain-containing protein [Pseudonocardia phyllosphaerae]|uniref:DUF6286 domain-containing protein n=1 Tax=Pseudonocardia phyllosphaerae TaxID=3390502 RepID=UPI003979A9F0